MPSDRELLRPNSGTRLICRTIELQGPLTQRQVSALANMTIGGTCKCMKLLEQAGHIRRISQTSNVKGGMKGKLPWLYATTVKPLPDIQTRRKPQAPTPNELCDVMNAIIRRRS